MLARVRWLRWLALVHTGHPQPMAGTPTEVPVPRKINSPGNSIVRTRLFTTARSAVILPPGIAKATGPSGHIGRFADPVSGRTCRRGGDISRVNPS